MKTLLFLIFSILTISLYSKDLPVMLKVKADFNLNHKVITTFRSGAEDSLTAHGYMLISQEQQEEALEEQANQRKSDCYDDACLVDTGKMMAAQMIFIVNVTKMKNEYIFKARLIDLETGSTKRTVTKVYKGRLSSASELLKFAKELTDEALADLVEQLSNEDVKNDNENIPQKEIKSINYSSYKKTNSSLKKYWLTLDTISETKIIDFDSFLGATLSIANIRYKKMNYSIFKIGYLKSFITNSSRLRIGLVAVDYYPIKNMFLNFNFESIFGASDFSLDNLNPFSLGATIGGEFSLYKNINYKIYLKANFDPDIIDFKLNEYIVVGFSINYSFLKY